MPLKAKKVLQANGTCMTSVHCVEHVCNHTQMSIYSRDVATEAQSAINSVASGPPPSTPSVPSTPLCNSLEFIVPVVVVVVIIVVVWFQFTSVSSHRTSVFCSALLAASLTNTARLGLPCQDT